MLVYSSMHLFNKIKSYSYVCDQQFAADKAVMSRVQVHQETIPDVMLI